MTKRTPVFQSVGDIAAHAPASALASGDAARVGLYVRVSTDDQSAGIEVQRAALEQAAQHRGWNVTEIGVDNGYSGKNTSRPALQRLLTLAVNGDIDIICVFRLDRLSRSLLDFAQMMEKARKQGWAIVALDLGLDMTTPAGALVANVMAAVAEWERQTISARTKAAMAVKKAQGVHCGRKRRISADVVALVREARTHGRSYADIAHALEEAQIPTVNGGKTWQTSTLRRIA